MSDIEQLDNVDGDEDFLIVCAGFEKRSLGVINRLGRYHFRESFLLKYEKVVDVPSANDIEKKAYEQLSKLGKVTEIMINPMDPIPALQSLFASMGEIDKKTIKISIDISVMSKYLLLLLFRFLCQKEIIDRVRILYTEPDHYVDEDKTPLAYGSAKFEPVPTFEGMNNPRSSNLLIIMLGFEGDRAYSVWDRLEPDACVLTVPTPPYKTDWKNKTREANIALIEAIGNANVRDISAKNPQSVLNSLNAIVDEYDPNRNMNCTIVPMGTKLQTLGAFFFYWQNQFNPTIMYTYPIKHSDYSKGIGHTNIISIPKIY